MPYCRCSYFLKGSGFALRHRETPFSTQRSTHSAASPIALWGAPSSAIGPIEVDVMLVDVG